MRDKSVLRKLLGLCVATVVVVGRELLEGGEGGRDRLDVWVRTRAGREGVLRQVRGRVPVVRQRRR